MNTQATVVTHTGSLKRRRRQALIGAAYIAPSFILMTIFNVIPIFVSLYLSFCKYNMVGSPVWIGLENYRKLASNKALGDALINTVKYVLMTVPVQTILALLIAAFIAERLKNRYGSFLRSVIFIPVIVSLIASATVWSIMYETNGGLLNQLLGLFGVPAVNFLGSKQTALASVAAVAVWKNTGYYMVIYYAGIMNVSPEIHEAAVVDGAKAHQRFWYITLPMLKPITYMIVTLGIIGSFQVFDLVYKMTGGGPGYATKFIVQQVYQAAFVEDRMGYASAMSIVLMLIIGVFTLLQFRLSGKEQDYE